MSEKQTVRLYSPDTEVSHTEIGMEGMSLAPVLEKLAGLGKVAVEGEPYDNPVVFNYKDEKKLGQVMHRADSGTFIVWPMASPEQPGIVTGELGMVPLKPYRVPAEDIRPLDPNIDQ